MKKVQSKKEDVIYISEKESVLDFYNSLNSFEDINRLIEEGEVESDYLECKRAEACHLGSGIKKTIITDSICFCK